MKHRALALAAFALALLVARGAEASNTYGPYSVEILINGVPQPVYGSGGTSFVAGAYGASYQIRVHNGSGRRIEAVVAVDGRDVVTGQPVDPRRHRGYIVGPYGSASVDGFRSTAASVATFRFSTIPRSYAWRTGTAWGIGTVRVWVFEEAVPVPVMPYPTLPYGVDGMGRRGAGGAPSAEAAPGAVRDMGTEYGEQRWSPVSYTAFQRASGSASATLGIRYQSREALVAAGIIGPVWTPEPVYPVTCVGCPPPYGYYPYAPPPPGYPYY